MLDGCYRFLNVRAGKCASGQPGCASAVDTTLNCKTWDFIERKFEVLLLLLFLERSSLWDDAEGYPNREKSSVT